MTRRNEGKIQLWLLPLAMLLALVCAAPAEARVVKTDQIIWPSNPLPHGAAMGICQTTSKPGIACFNAQLPTKGKRTWFNLGRTGRTEIRHNTRLNLKPGGVRRVIAKDHWVRNGVRCYLNTHKGIRCKNRDGHGFKLNPLSLTYETF